MQSDALSPSEVIVLCGAPFVDDVRARDSTTERPMAGGPVVKAERLAVAAIRAAILVNRERGALEVSWEGREGIDALLDEAAAIGGSGAKALRKLAGLAVIETAINTPKPRLRCTGQPIDWPARTVESRLAQSGTTEPLSVFHHVDDRLGKKYPPSSAGLICMVKAALVQRGLLTTRRRAFGLLQPGHHMPDALKRTALTQSEALRSQLAAARQRDPQLWHALAASITIALNSGFS